MNLVTKIAKLTRIPQILRRKQEAERDSKKKRDESYPRAPFPLKEKPISKKLSDSSYPDLPPSPAEPSKTTRDGIGNRIDVTI